MVRKRWFSNTTPKSYASPVNGRECTPPNERIQLFYVAESHHEIFRCVAQTQHHAREVALYTHFSPGTLVAHLIHRTMDHLT